MRVKDAVGRFGEDVAAAFLTDAGLTILDRNWRCAAGEIDIVAREGAVLVICEVKTRSSSSFGEPIEAVTRTKAVRLHRLSAMWLAGRRAGGEPQFWPQLRFDVVGVVRHPNRPPVVSHVRGAF